MTMLAPKDFDPLLPDLQGVPAFLVTLDKRERPVVAWANDDFAGLSGMSFHHRSTVYLDDLLTDLGVEEPCAEARPGMSQTRWAVRGRDQSGRPCWYEFDIRTAAGLQSEIGRVAWLWFVSNDSARIAAQMRVAEAFAPAPAESADKDGDQAYILDVAHDMRTPLSAVIGALSLLSERHAEDETARRLIEMAKRNSDHLLALTDDLLDTAGTENCGFSIEPHAVNASDLLSAAVRAYSATALGNRVFLSLDQMPDDAWLHADPRRLHQVMTNLISNAIKYAPPGSAVNISCASCNGEVALTVSDHGKGIPAADRDQVFRRHFKSRNPAQDRPEGAGLGLAIVHDLVERQGGRITLSSHSKDDGPGATGTRVTVSFPRIERNSQAV